MAEHAFAWRGIDRTGQTVQGESRGHDKAQIIQELRAQRIRVTQIQRQYSVGTWLALHAHPQVNKSELTRFTRQLATLLKAGVPLLQALDILNRGETRLALTHLIRSLHHQIESGLSFHQALRQHPYFDALYCNLIAVGELTGMLDTMLERLAVHLEKSENLKRVLRTALLYPCMVLLVAGVVLIVIMLFVVPAFQSIFSSFGAELPGLTRWVIAVSEWLQRHGGSLIAIIAGMVWWLKRQFQQRANWQTHLHRFCFKLPIAGALTRDACSARWTRTLATLFISGIPLTEALGSMKTVTGNRLFDQATEVIQAQLMRGISLSHALAQTHGLFPPMLVQMCAIGEESGALDQLLLKTAEHYEQVVDNTVARLSTLLEPMIMVVLGVLIGGLVMALYLPIFKLGQVV